MTGRRNLAHRLDTLSEIRSIMSSMKMLALLETRKLTRYLGNQRRVLNTFEAVGADFMQFFGPPLRDKAVLDPLYLLFGAERGFNGDFNQRIVQTYEEISRDRPGGALVIGQKLALSMKAGLPVSGYLDGPLVAEEVAQVVDVLVSNILDAFHNHGNLELVAVYHGDEGGDVQTLTVFPPFKTIRADERASGYPPMLNVSALQFLSELLDEYLFAVLHGLLFITLISENQQRIEHIEGAVRRLDERCEQLAARQRKFRQEEITEEIEVILLSASAMGSSKGPGSRWPF